MTASGDKLAGLTFGLATEGDIPDLLRLINGIQPHVPWDEEMLRWQYHEPPAGPARVYVARSEAGEIVAQYVAVRYDFRLVDHDRTSWMVQDVMTYPAYRGRGILHELGRRSLDDIRAAGDLGHTFPNERSDGSFRRTGWQRLATVPARSRPLGGTGGAEAGLLTEVDGPAAFPTFPEGYVGVRRDRDYLTWRYRKPRAPYRFFVVDGHGWAVTKAYSEGGTTTWHLLDFHLPGHGPDTKAAVDAVAERAAADGASTLTAWLLDDHPAAPHFDAANLSFPAERRAVSVYVEGPPGDLALLTDRRRWHLTQGDSDVY